MKLDNVISNLFLGQTVSIRSLSNSNLDDYFYLTIQNIENSRILENKFSQYLSDKKLRKFYENFKNQYFLEYGDIILYVIDEQYDMLFYENTINKKVIPSDDFIVLRSSSSILRNILNHKGGKQFFLHELNNAKKNTSDFITFMQMIKQIDIDDDILLLSELDKDNKPNEDKINLADIKIFPRTTSLYNIINRLKNKEINIFTHFQREASLWKDNKIKSSFIESILINFFPLPYFYFDASDNKDEHGNDDYDTWLVIDGLQRLTTIKDFVIDKSFILTDLEYLTELNGKRYDQLERKYQRILEEREITFFLIYKGTPSSVRYSIFRRLNQSEPLNRQEIRNALNFRSNSKSDFNLPLDYINTLVNIKEFKQVVDLPLESEQRMENREIALRYVAFRLYIDKSLKPSIFYQKDIEAFLDNAMKHIYVITKPILNQYKIEFQKSLGIMLNLFDYSFFWHEEIKSTGEQPSFDKILFELWACAIAELSDKERKLLQDNLRNNKALLQEHRQRARGVLSYCFYDKKENYEKIHVDLRFSIARKYIKSIINDKSN